MSTIAENIAKVAARIREAAQAAGRDPATVGLLAVSKTKPAAAVREAHAAGLRDFGENYLQGGPRQAGRTGRPALELALHRPHPVEQDAAHRRAFPVGALGGPVEDRAAPVGATPGRAAALNVCLQVNVSGEASKSGCAPEDLPALAEAVKQLPNLRLRGLMAIPEPTAERAAQHAAFARLRELLLDLNLGLDTLSMGMSDDLEAAIGEGATWVRIGTALFGARDYGAPAS